MEHVLSDAPVTRLFLNARLATMTGNRPYGAVEKGAMAISNQKILWVGPQIDLPDPMNRSAQETWDLDGRWVTPGLVDCHTHLVHAGNRATEFEQRLKGVSYEEIARQGGGILSTVRATRKASADELLSQSARRLENLLGEGVTTVEIKSGYGLDLETEIKMLECIKKLAAQYPVSIQATFLGAHALPPEFAGRSDEYLDLVINQMLPTIAQSRLAQAVDVFCENIAFSKIQTERLFQAAARYSLPVKIHAEQLSNQQGATLAAHYQALSADHLEYLDESGAQALASAGTVAVLLPGAFYFLGETRKPPVDLLRKYKVPMAVATDANPGTSPTESLILMLNMACTLFRLTPEEALAGITRNAAKALGLQTHIGTLEPGKQADFVIWDIESPAELACRFGWNPKHTTIRAGKTIRNKIR